ncbi:unnamed protein product, partial [Heterosigma akashiwo]
YEAGYAGSRILNYVNETILLERGSQELISIEEKTWDHRFCEQLGGLLALVSVLEVIAEKGAETYGGYRAKWRVIQTIERIKAITRLVILFYRASMLIDGGKLFPGQQYLPDPDLQQANGNRLGGSVGRGPYYLRTPAQQHSRTPHHRHLETTDEPARAASVR